MARMSTRPRPTTSRTPVSKAPKTEKRRYPYNQPAEAGAGATFSFRSPCHGPPFRNSSIAEVLLGVAEGKKCRSDGRAPQSAIRILTPSVSCPDSATMPGSCTASALHPRARSASRLPRPLPSSARPAPVMVAASAKSSLPRLAFCVRRRTAPKFLHQPSAPTLATEDARNPDCRRRPGPQKNLSGSQITPGSFRQNLRSLCPKQRHALSPRLSLLPFFGRSAQRSDYLALGCPGKLLEKFGCGSAVSHSRRKRMTVCLPASG